MWWCYDEPSSGFCKQHRNVIKTHFVETYQRKGCLFLCFICFWLWWLLHFSLVFRLFQELKSSCGTFLRSSKLRIRFYSWKTSSDQDKTSLKHNTSYVARRYKALRVRFRIIKQGNYYWLIDTRGIIRNHENQKSWAHDSE